MSTPYAKLPALGRLRPDPAASTSLVAFLVAGLVVLLIGENPLEAAGHPGRRRLRLRRRASATRSTTPPTSSSPGLPSRSPSMPACSTSAARARPISAASASALVCLALRRMLPWWLTFPLAILGGGAVRRALGAHPGLAAGQARQPHRHHHDHVQLHRRRADGLSAGQRAEAGRRRWRRRRAPSPRARNCRSSAGCSSMFGLDIAHARRSTSPSCWRCVACVPRLGADLAHQARLRDPHHRPQPDGGALCRHLRDAHHHHHHADLRRAGRHDGAQPDHGRPAPSALDFVGGAGFVGIAVALMGRSHPVGIVLGRDPVRRALPGRRRTRLRHAHHLPRHDRRHPGPGHPVRRRAGAHVPARRVQTLFARSVRDRSACRSQAEGA